MTSIREADLAAILALHSGARGGSSWTLESWAEARDVDATAVRKYAGMLTRNALELVTQRIELEDMPELTAVPLSIAAAVTCAFQIGVDAERCRRDALELPSVGPADELGRGDGLGG